MKLQGKVAIVTGGARGIGAAIAHRYADEGARVAVADVLRDEAEKTAAAIGRGAFAVEVDVTSGASIDALVERTVATAGGIDILVNGAAIFDMGGPLEVSEQSYDRQFAINVKGLLFTLRACAKQMKVQGRGGKIVNFSSEAGRLGHPQVTVYCATKAAVISITQSAGLALIKDKINVNAIAPGVVDTPMWDTVDALFCKAEGLPPGTVKRRVGEAVPYGRMGVPEDIVGTAVFLASEDAGYVVGQTINVCGGNRLN